MTRHGNARKWPTFSKTHCSPYPLLLQNTGGILHERKPSAEPVHLRVRSSNLGFTGTMVLRERLVDWAEAINTDRSPLSGRGWVLQERILPSRTLHFGEQHIFWECRTAVWSEALKSDPDTPETGSWG